MTYEYALADSSSSRASPTSSYTYWARTRNGYDCTGELTSTSYANFANAPADASQTYDYTWDGPARSPWIDMATYTWRRGVLLWESLQHLFRGAEQDMNNYLSANSFNAGAGYWGGVGGAYTPGSGTSTEFGIVTPQAGASWHYSYDTGNTGLRW